MKIITPLLLALFLNACSPPVPKAADCNLPSYSSDTIQLRDFRRYLAERGIAHPFIPASDTMYCFQGEAGWGAFDYLCSLYRDSTGYKAAFTHVAQKRYGDSLTFCEQIKPISTAAWQQVQKEFYDRNFWCRTYEFTCTVMDGDDYYVWGREGNKFRLVKWDDLDCATNIDSLVMLGKNIWDLCGGPMPTWTADYSIKGDSVHAFIYSSDFGSSFFIKNRETEIYYTRQVLPQKDGCAELVLPKKEVKSLKRVEIIEYGLDGSIRRCRVSEVHERKDR